MMIHRSQRATLKGLLCSATFHLFGRTDTVVTQVKWPEEEWLLGDDIPSRWELEENEIEVEGKGACSKVEDFFTCHCGAKRYRLRWEYEA